VEMQITGKFSLKDSIQEVWAFLLEPGTLASCIPGAEKMEAIDERTYVGVVKQKVGPITAKFQFTTTLTELDPPRYIKAVGSGSDKGMVGPFAHEMIVKLTEISKDEVEIAYDVKVNIRGSVPVFGRLLMESKAKALEREFTKTLQEKLRSRTSGSMNM